MINGIDVKGRLTAMKRLLLCLVLVAALALVAGCGAKKTSTGPGPTSTSHTPVTLTVWHPGRSPPRRRASPTRSRASTSPYPWITLKIVELPRLRHLRPVAHPGDQGRHRARRAISFGPDYVGQYAHDGLWLDLKPYLARDHFPVDQFAPAALTYCQFEGKEVALPVLTDAYGLYYNKDMFAKAGISGPPKTMTELMADAKKLTVRDTNDSIESPASCPSTLLRGARPSPTWRAPGAARTSTPGQAAARDRPRLGCGHDWQKQLSTGTA